MDHLRRSAAAGASSCSNATASKLHIGPAQIERAERWFERYGEPVVLFGRMVPLIRAFVSLPAGVARMPFWRFTVLSLLGSIPWVLALAFAGHALGSDWTTVRKGFQYVDYLILAADRRRDRLCDRAPARRQTTSRIGRAGRTRPRASRGGERRRRGLQLQRGDRRELSASAMGPPARLSLRHALALGLAHGPTELLPISSSAHTILIPFLAGWPYAELDPELRKSFEVALHAGTARGAARRHARARVTPVAQRIAGSDRAPRRGGRAVAAPARGAGYATRAAPSSAGSAGRC